MLFTPPLARRQTATNVETQRCEHGCNGHGNCPRYEAPDFSLPATDGRTYALGDIAAEKGTVVVFICNHCPYVKAVIDRIAANARVLLAEGIGFAAICSNDARAIPRRFF